MDEYEQLSDEQKLENAGYARGRANGEGISFLERHPLLFGPRWDGKVRFPRGLRDKDGKLQKAGTLLVKGYSDKKVRKLSGLSNAVIAKLRLILEEKVGKPLRTLPLKTLPQPNMPVVGKPRFKKTKGWCASMSCPVCASNLSVTINTDPHRHHITRRRVCINGHRYTTHETIHLDK